jgi:hypothetical protein
MHVLTTRGTHLPRSPLNPQGYTCIGKDTGPGPWGGDGLACARRSCTHDAAPSGARALLPGCTPGLVWLLLYAHAGDTTQGGSVAHGDLRGNICKSCLSHALTSSPQNSRKSTCAIAPALSHLALTKTVAACSWTELARGAIDARQDECESRPWYRTPTTAGARARTDWLTGNVA